MAKDKKNKAAEKKARVAEKQSKKATKKEKKGKTKNAADGDSDAEDIDLDAVLAEYAKQQEQYLKVTEIPCDPPPPRSSSTLIASPSNSNELFMFGGEYFNGSLALFYNDLFVYHIERDEWRKVTSPNSPLPRSGHAWCRGGNAGGIYLFGGEFSSPKQGTFYHYNDFWYLDPATREWTRLEGKGKGPPARSGHRMTYFKNYVLLFGGFQDTSQQTKYLQDLWVYDCQNYVWHNPVLPPASQKPDARSSFSFLPNDAGAVLYGGYSRVKASANVGRQGKGGSQSTRVVMKPVVHQDTWFLRVAQPSAENGSNAPPMVRWERRKKPANPPNPPRAGATMAHHKGRGIMYGGVHDVEESEEGIESEFFETLFAWNIERNRYFPLVLRRPRNTAKKNTANKGGGRRGRGKADEEELLRNLAALETGKQIGQSESMDLSEGKEVEDEEMPDRPQKTMTMEMPHRRFNAQLAVQDDVLYIYGGTFESGDREYTFDDMWAIDLGKLDGVKEIFQRELENWQGSEDEESDEDEDEGDESDEEEDIDPASRIPEANDKDGEKPVAADESHVSDTEMEDSGAGDTGPDGSSLEDSVPHPRPFETLRDFFNRTSTLWQEVLLEELRSRREEPGAKSIKELRADAFNMAEGKWWDCREEIRALEDEQEEAGIGEVVSIADRASKEGGGLPRRR
ncbi:MAG: hypothetical protein M4579_001435 [Chaenotheca gracillima]|nr:MAG: hypothetical protein M4579_001435 [Chaenotheca gracillima]